VPPDAAQVERRAGLAPPNGMTGNGLKSGRGGASLIDELIGMQTR
jgi:hypothetical protein